MERLREYSICVFLPLFFFLTQFFCLVKSETKDKTSVFWLTYCLTNIPSREITELTVCFLSIHRENHLEWSQVKGPLTLPVHLQDVCILIEAPDLIPLTLFPAAWSLFSLSHFTHHPKLLGKQSPMDR